MFDNLYLLEELNDRLQWRMALWIPSCCCNRESSLLLAGGTTPAEDDAERLFPRCLHTTRSPAGKVTCFSSDSSFLTFIALLGEHIGALIGDINEAINSPEQLIFSLRLFETLRYRGLISFIYFRTTSFGKLLDSTVDASSDRCFCNLQPELLQL